MTKKNNEELEARRRQFSNKFVASNEIASNKLSMLATEKIEFNNEKKFIDANEKCISMHNNHKNYQDVIVTATGSTRYFVALLGLAIAIVNCYAQATFCIAIVEMVLPPDLVIDDEAASVVKVTGASAPLLPEISADQSCPIEYRYRDYYDSWRFPSRSQNATNQQQPPVSTTQISGNLIDLSNRFDWDASRQGLLLGAFAIGTAPLQVLGGRLAEIYGAKWVLLAGCIGTAITNLTIPFLAHFSFVLLIANRVLMGISQAGMEPGLMCLLSEWLAPTETGFFISMLMFAMCIGFFLGSLGSSFLLTLGFGWSIAYYVAGGLNLLMGLIWLLFASSRPRDSKLISKEELNYIKQSQSVIRSIVGQDCHEVVSKANGVSKEGSWNNIKNISKQEAQFITMTSTPPDCKKNLMEQTSESCQSSETKQAPWLNIFSTPSVWAFIICKISIRWCADVLSIELPTYLANVLHLSIKLNGIVNSVSSALFAIFSFISGYFVNEILKNNQLANSESSHKVGLSKTNIRKVSQSIASFGAAITVFLMTHYDCNILFSMSMLLLLSCCLVMGTGGELQIPYDMTPRYPGTLHGMACTLSVSGWLAPPLIGLILGDQPSSRYRWSIVWYLTAAINLIGGLVFVLFADASPRDFDQVPKSSPTSRVAPTTITPTPPTTTTTSDKAATNQQHHRQHSAASVETKNDEHENKKPSSSSSPFAQTTPHLRKREPFPFPPCHQVETKSQVNPLLFVHEQKQLHQNITSATGYYNVACRPSEDSPPSTQRFNSVPSRSLTAANYNNDLQQQQKTTTKVNANHNLNSKGSWIASSANEQQKPYFDRELIRVRQLEESCIRPPGYLVGMETIPAPAIIIPYQASPPNYANSRQFQTRLRSDDGSGTGGANVLRLLWTKLWRGHRKEMALINGNLEGPGRSKSALGASCLHRAAARDELVLSAHRSFDANQQLVGAAEPSLPPAELAGEVSMVTAPGKTITHL